MINKPILILVRQNAGDLGCPGRLCDLSYQDGKLICYTLERPNWNNVKDDKATPENESSCISAGKYEVIPFISNNKDINKVLGNKVFKILNIPGGRDGVYFHIANWIHQLNGCIALGKNLIWDKVEMRFALENSRIAMEKLLTAYPNGFWLEIKEL